MHNSPLKEHLADDTHIQTCVGSLQRMVIDRSKSIAINTPAHLELYRLLSAICLGLFRDVFWGVQSLSRFRLRRSRSRLRFMIRMKEGFLVRIELNAAVKTNDVYIACDRAVGADVDACGDRDHGFLCK